MKKQLTPKQKRLRQKREERRWQFWARMMVCHPRLFSWCNKHLPFDTLPF